METKFKNAQDALASLRQEISLDLADLKTAIQSQSGTYLHFAELLVDARKERDSLTTKLKQHTAEIELDLRAHWDDSVKMTESGVRARLDSNPELYTLQEEITDAQAAVSIYDGVLTALEHKRSMITNVVRLQAMHLDGTVPDRACDVDSVSGEVRRELRADLSTKETPHV